MAQLLIELFSEEIPARMQGGAARDLERMAALEPLFILPNHGDPGIISAGGYHKGFIKAQQQYIRMLKRCRHDPVLRKQPLEELIAGPLSRGWINMFEPYRAIHAQNLERVLESEAKPR